MRFTELVIVANSLDLTLTGKSGRYSLNGYIYKTLKEVQIKLEGIKSERQTTNTQPENQYTNNSDDGVNALSERGRERSGCDDLNYRDTEDCSSDCTINQVPENDGITQGTIRDKQGTGNSFDDDGKDGEVRDPVQEPRRFELNCTPRYKPDYLSYNYIENTLDIIQRISNRIPEDTDFDTSQALQVCGDLLIPRRVNRFDTNTDYWFYRCVEAEDDNLQCFVIFLNNEDYQGFIYHDLVTGYWFDDLNCYQSVNDYLNKLDITMKPVFEITDDNWLLLTA